MARKLEFFAFRTLRAKFLALIVPLVLISTVIVFGISELTARREANRKLHAKLDQIVEIQSAVLSESLWNVAEEQIALILAAIAIDTDVLGVIVYDESNNPIASVGAVEAIEQQEFFAEKDITYLSGDDPEVIGRLALALTDARVRGESEARLFVAVGLAALLLLSVVTIALVANRRTIGIPLERLLESINQSRQGGERTPVNWTSRDEIGVVVSAFNEMQARQQAYETELHKARVDLERRVEERTRALAMATDQAKQAEAQLIEAIESISEGFSLYDPDDNLVVCNSRYHEQLYPGMSHVVQPGTSFETVIRSAVERGLIEEVHNFDSVDDWVAERLERHRDPSGTYIQHRGKHQWIQISERRTEDGGYVAVYTDITVLKEHEEELEEAYRIIKGQKERMEDELNIGREIQMSMIPLVFPAFPDHDEFSIFAMLKPAREVAGDFYDFYFVDEDRMCFCIGDVSGKGVAAALFMAMTKTLIKSRAADDRSPASILTHLNNELNANNKKSMFVTLFVGIMNIRTGEFVYTNAGHNPSYLKRRDGDLLRLDRLHGPMVGAMEGMIYQEDEDIMAPGDLLLLYTDGVTEAMDVGERMFSEDRLKNLLLSAGSGDAEAVVGRTVAAVEAFKGEMEQADDITVLGLAFHGSPQDARVGERRIVIKNDLLEIATVQEKIDAFAEEFDIPVLVARKLKVIFDELLNNVISYAYRDDAEHDIETRVELTGKRLTVTITDDGVPFNPLSAATPDTNLPLEEREIGGLGIHLVRSLVDDVSYQRRIDKNVMTMTMHLERHGEAS